MVSLGRALLHEGRSEVVMDIEQARVVTDYRVVLQQVKALVDGALGA